MNKMGVRSASLTTSVMCVLLIVSMASLSSASPLLTRLWSEWPRQARAPCRPAWGSLRHVCWSPVPQAVTSLLDADTQADLYCRQLDTRAVNLDGLYVCVEDADTGASDSAETDELLRREFGSRHKRLMGNNGY